MALYSRSTLMWYSRSCSRVRLRMGMVIPGAALRRLFCVGGGKAAVVESQSGNSTLVLGWVM